MCSSTKPKLVIKYHTHKYRIRHYLCTVYTKDPLQIYQPPCWISYRPNLLLFPSYLISHWPNFSSCWPNFIYFIASYAWWPCRDSIPQPLARRRESYETARARSLASVVFSCSIVAAERVARASLWDRLSFCGCGESDLRSADDEVFLPYTRVLSIYQQRKLRCRTS